MSKIYESKATGRGLYGEKYKIKFMQDASTVTKDNPSGFGWVVSDNPHLLKQAQIKNDKGQPVDSKTAALAIEAMIEGEKDFIDRVAGKKGIWLRSERITAEGKATFTDYRKKLRDQGEASLRQMIADNGGTVPAKATIDELVAATLNAMANPKSTVQPAATDS